MSPLPLAIWLVRPLAILHAAMTIAQPLSIGRYLDGVIGALDWHSILGSTLVVVTMAMGAAALIAVALRGTFWLLLAPTLLFFAEGLQIGMGHSRVLSLHVPLGVIIVVVAIWYAIWVCLPRIGHPRARSTRAVVTPGFPGVVR